MPPEDDDAYGRIGRLGPRRARVLLVLIHALILWGVVRLAWAFTEPGLNGPVLAEALEALVPAGIGWAAWWIYTVRRYRRTPRFGWLAPVVLAFLVLFLAADAPLLARWAASEAAFRAEISRFPDASPANGDPDDDPQPLAVPARIGDYDIDYAAPIPGGYIFRDVHGGVFGDAGFAWLPAGPPKIAGWSFGPIGGGWYTYTH